MQLVWSWTAPFPCNKMIFSKLLQLGLTMSKYVLNSMSGQTVTYYNILREAIVNRRKFFCKKKSYMWGGGGGVLWFYRPKKVFFCKKKEELQNKINHKSLCFGSLAVCEEVFIFHFWTHQWRFSCTSLCCAHGRNIFHVSTWHAKDQYRLEKERHICGKCFHNRLQPRKLHNKSWILGRLKRGI